MLNFLFVGDHTLRIWNTKKDARPVMSIRANQGEVLTCDWCKYNQNIIATAGTDCKICGWDLRRPGEPVYVLQVCHLMKVNLCMKLYW